MRRPARLTFTCGLLGAVAAIGTALVPASLPARLTPHGLAEIALQPLGAVAILAWVGLGPMTLTWCIWSVAAWPGRRALAWLTIPLTSISLVLGMEPIPTAVTIAWIGMMIWLEFFDPAVRAWRQHRANSRRPGVG